SDWIRDPAIDVRFMPAGAVSADPDLRRERSLRDLSVDGGAGQPRPRKNGLQTDDTILVAHGRAASCWLFLKASWRRQGSGCSRARELFASSCCGVALAENRMDQIPRPRPLPRSMP